MPFEYPGINNGEQKLPYALSSVVNLLYIKKETRFCNAKISECLIKIAAADCFAIKLENT